MYGLWRASVNLRCEHYRDSSVEELDKLQAYIDKSNLAAQEKEGEEGSIEVLLFVFLWLL